MNGSIASCVNNGPACDGPALGFAVILGLGFCVLYFLPALIGSRRDVTAFGWLLFVNSIFGWTLFGWLLCLLWAVLGVTEDQEEFYRRANSKNH